MTEPTPTPEPESAELQTLGFWPTFLYYFTTTSVIGALAAAQSFHLGLSDGQPFLYGIPLGLLAGGVGAYYNRTIALEISAPQVKQFTPKLQQLQQLLAELGYATDPAKADEAGFQIYCRSGLSYWFSGNLLVKASPTSATIVGRARLIRRLKQHLQ